MKDKSRVLARLCFCSVDKNRSERILEGFLALCTVESSGRIPGPEVPLSLPNGVRIYVNISSLDSTKLKPYHVHCGHRTTQAYNNRI